MSLRHVYERTFDEDIPTTEQSSSGCPECGGLVHTTSTETACEDCGLILEDRPSITAQNGARLTKGSARSADGRARR